VPAVGGEDEKAGSGVTLTGTLQSAQVFEVDDAACEPPANITPSQVKNTPNYTATLHASVDGYCVV
jgi:hypothetical protein